MENERGELVDLYVPRKVGHHPVDAGDGDAETIQD